MALPRPRTLSEGNRRACGGPRGTMKGGIFRRERRLKTCSGGQETDHDEPFQMSLRTQCGGPAPGHQGRAGAFSKSCGWCIQWPPSIAIPLQTALKSSPTPFQVSKMALKHGCIIAYPLLNFDQKRGRCVGPAAAVQCSAARLERLQQLLQHQ